MSTKIQFSPNTTSPFTFQPVIAGIQYTAIVTWNVWEERYYLNLFDSAGVLQVSAAIVASGPHTSATLNWVDTGLGGVAVVTAADPHNVPVGRLANIHISQTDSPYDGEWQALATGPTTMTFALPNPNQSQPLGGQLSFNVNLVQALGNGWLIYRFDVQQFEFETAQTS